VSDPGRVVAYPLEVVPLADAVGRVKTYCEELGVAVIVIGLPTSLSGVEGPAARAARDFGQEIASATGLNIEFVDERFTTNTAERAMIGAGVRRRRRRQTIDKVAAAVILQTFLDRPQ
jgi:putative Holliday junction resolvase